MKYKSHLFLILARINFYSLQLADIINVSVDYFFANLEVEIYLANVAFHKYSYKMRKTDEEAVIEKSKNVAINSINMLLFIQ